MPLSRTINCNFSGLAFSELTPNHFSTLLRSHLRLENAFSGFALQLYSVLSSAKLQTSDFVIEKNKSLITIRKVEVQELNLASFMDWVLISYHELNAAPVLVHCLRSQTRFI